MKVTEHQVHTIADRLHQAGERPTLAKIRQELGGGSFTTISEAMKLWHARHAEDQELKHVDVPDAVLDRVQQTTGALWRAAMEEADKRLTGEREAMVVKEKAIIAELEEARDAVKTLEAEDAQRLAEIRDLQDKLKSAESLAADERERRQKADAEVVRLQESNLRMREHLDDAIQGRQAAEALADKLVQGGKKDEAL